MSESFPLRKMATTLGGRVGYALHTDKGFLDLAGFIGKPFGLRATGVLTCTVCGRKVPKFYGQGFCFPCFRDAPEASECIIKPELCQAHLGLGRDPEWERAHHAQDHVVYLSHTGGLKVGVTRTAQVPTRWIDQGAVTAMVIGRTPYRQLAGLMEVDLKRLFSDKTDWRAMLRNVAPDIGLLSEARERARAALRHDLRDYLAPDEEPVPIMYPVLAWPPKVTSVQLGRTPEVSGRLMGVKAQYLIWEDGRVLNVRNHAGHHVELTDGQGPSDLFSGTL